MEESWIEGIKPKNPRQAGQQPEKDKMACGLSKDDVLREDNPLFAEIMRAAPILCLDVPRDEDNYVPSAKDLEEAVSPTRWLLMGCFYFIFASSIQAYVVKQLRNVVHYTLQMDQYESMRVKLESVFKRIADPALVPRVVVIRRCYEDTFVSVKNNLAFEDISRFVWGFAHSHLTTSTADKTRGHVYLDIGMTGNNNSTRSDDFQGIPMPNVFKHTSEPGFSAVFVAMPETISEVWSDLVGLVYNDEERTAMFAGTFGPLNYCETIRAALQTVLSFVTTTPPDDLHRHTDKNNDHKNPAYSKVFGFNWLKWDSIRLLAKCLVVLAYGKMSVWQFIARLAFYKTNVDAVVLFYRNLPKCQKVIDPDLIPGFGQPPLVLPNPHLVKSVFYSSFSWRILQMETRYPAIKKNPWLKASLVLNTGVSNCPDHFYETIGHLLKNPSMLDCGSLGDPIDPFTFNYDLCLAVWSEKESQNPSYISLCVISQHTTKGPPSYSGATP